ncbi:MAG: dihydrofolate reductase [Alteromonadaceae bacterium]|nr:dihydrofolate reductase [Alteromonadaceae bacterium]|tara:strand:+ start:4892 stop:5395 length:504 start_codon:yes stop_codon:yes gene_type:complete
MIKALMVAMSRNRVIGRSNKLPWYLPEDLKYFKRTTLGKPMIMGRKTFESIGRPLPGRANLVVTRDAAWQFPGVRVLHSLADAYRSAEAQAEIDGVDEVMVIGGGEIFTEALPDADRLYLTEVHAEIEGDAFFPELDWDQWREISREDHGASDNNGYDYSFVVYDRA